jgi:hypothetical protein
MMIGAILLAFGLYYLVSQVRTMNLMIDKVSNEVIENRDIDCQSNEMTIYEVSDEELSAVIMGYREYPIIIDGNLVHSEGTDSETYLSYITASSYAKSYIYDSQRNIKQIVFSHKGT